MAVILELDQGNTRCKWRLLDVGRGEGTSVVARGVLSADFWQMNSVFPELWTASAVNRVRVANVAGLNREKQMAARLSEDLGLTPEFARVTPRCYGVTCAYPEPGRLGVDRWLAVLAAHKRDLGPALVVDCGSAVTLDLLGEGGAHLGGYIVPGLSLMRRALYRDTDAVKVDPSLVPGMTLSPGRDTAAAVNRGLSLMVLGTIEQAYEELRRVCPESAAPNIWMTGGDSAFFSTLPPLNSYLRHQVVDDLVMEGLALTNP
ncbi:type III pantothenate kinase [Microbulbifer aggregans]|uniref:type III pantothenate kinase n=1 Tax=Microbulbifer aggregans TaxID=1769779 RepID=UPI001CFD5A1D|nr:type III pantothenate kinase [Microbulbifer aggregans]